MAATRRLQKVSEVVFTRIIIIIVHETQRPLLYDLVNI